MLATILLLGLVLTAAVTDFVRHKIYNWTTYTGLVIALALNAAGTALEYAPDLAETWRPWVGWVGLAESVAGLAVCGFCMLVCFVFFRIGGGDVKLVSMMGAFLGLEQGLEAMLWTFVLGGCAAIVVLIWRVGPATLVARSVRRALALVRLANSVPLSEEERRQLRSPLFLAPNAAVAVLLTRFHLLDWM
jgi:prepilin peptidase CpaA